MTPTGPSLAAGARPTGNFGEGECILLLYVVLAHLFVEKSSVNAEVGLDAPEVMGSCSARYDRRHAIYIYPGCHLHSSNDGARAQRSVFEASVERVNANL